MNKILVILSLCITSLSILGLVSAQSDMPTQFCTRWSPKQISNLSAVQTFIQTYGQQIDQSFTSNTDLLNLATTARQDLLSQLSLIQACDQNQTYTQSYATLVDLVKVYVGEIARLKEIYAHVSQLQEIPHSQSQILMLQSHLADLISQMPDAQNIQSQTDTSVKLMFSIPQQGRIYATISAQSDTTSAMQDAYRDGKFVIGGTISVQEFEGLTNMDLSGKLDANFTMSDSLYLTINDIQFDGTSSDTGTQDMIRTSKQGIGLLKTSGVQGKAIDLLSSEQGDMSALSLLLKQDTLLPLTIQKNLKNKALISRYSKSGSTYYGWRNTQVCNLLFVNMTDDPYSLRECQKNILDGLKSSGAQGMFMKESDGIYAMGISDRFTNEKLPLELQAYNNKELIKRNRQDILSIDVPFEGMETVYSEDINQELLRSPKHYGGLSYANNALKIEYSDDNAQLMLTGPVSRTHTNLYGSLILSGMSDGDEILYTTLRLEIKNPDLYKQTMALSASGSLGNQHIFDLDLNHSQSLSILNTLIKKKPSNALSFGALSQILDGLM